MDREAWHASPWVVKSWTQLSNSIITVIFGPPQGMLVVKNLPANAEDIRDTGSNPWSGSSPGGRHGNPLQYSCLENPMDRGT